MKKFIYKLVLICFPILFIIVGVNYYQDPANLFSNGKYEDKMISILLKNKNVTNVLNYHERLFQKKYLSQCDCPEIVVLGSSKMMLIDQKNVKNKTIINSSLSAGSVEDIISVFSLYEKNNCKPKEILIGLDPWLLNKNHESNRWKKLGKEYQDFLKKMNCHIGDQEQINSVSPLENYKQLFSFSYFQTSWVDFSRGVSKELYETIDPENKRQTKHVDGSISYEENYRNKSEEQILRNAYSEIAVNPLKCFGEFHELSPFYVQVFDKFTDYLKNSNIKITFVIPPYHPVVYDHFKKDNYYQIVFKAEKFFKNLAQKKGIKIIGSYNPKDFNFKNKDFYDGIHCDKQAIDYLFKHFYN